MTLLCIALCFASSLVGGVLGVQVFFWIGKPRVELHVVIRADGKGAAP